MTWNQNSGHAINCSKKKISSCVTVLEKERIYVRGISINASCIIVPPVQLRGPEGLAPLISPRIEKKTIIFCTVCKHQSVSTIPQIHIIVLFARLVVERLWTRQVTAFNFLLNLAANALEWQNSAFISGILSLPIVTSQLTTTLITH